MMSGKPEEPELGPARHRVFFALWPDAATRSAISRATRDAVQASGGRPIAKDRLHLTVAFLGELTAAGLDVARQVPPIEGGRVRADARRARHLARIEDLVAGAVRHRPTRSASSKRTCGTRSPSAAFASEERTYRPHVTLARRARPIDAAVAPVRWAVQDLALVESFPDGRNVHYEVLERWPL